jgi:hypothetical protein
MSEVREANPASTRSPMPREAAPARKRGRPPGSRNRPKGGGATA